MIIGEKWVKEHYNGESEFILPEGVMVIGNGAFKGCESLEKIVLPEGVTEIGDYAFDGCGFLKSIIIPESVKSIGWGAFALCDGVVIICKSDSYAEKYATEHHIYFDWYDLPF